MTCRTLLFSVATLAGCTGTIVQVPPTQKAPPIPQETTPSSSSASEPEAASAPKGSTATGQRAFHIRLEWPDGELYRGLIGWTLRSRCNGKPGEVKVSSSGGAWKVTWPAACEADKMEIELKLLPNWLRCEPPNYTGTVSPNKSIVIRLASSDTCHSGEQ